MTRINCTPIEELTRLPLLAEYRELPRVFGNVARAIERGETPDLSGQYTLGKGHMRFFYPRLGYLAQRHEQLVAEMQRRGYRTNYTTPLREVYSFIPPQWWGEWTPTEEAVRINRERIAERLTSSTPT